MTTCTVGAIALISAKGPAVLLAPMSNAINASVTMVERANNILLLMLKYFGLHGPPLKGLQQSTGSLWELPPEIFWLKFFLCYLIYKHIYPEPHKSTLESTRLYLKRKKKISWQLYLFCCTTASQNTTWFSFQFSLSVPDHMLWMLTHIKELLKGKNLASEQAALSGFLSWKPR